MSWRCSSQNCNWSFDASFGTSCRYICRQKCRNCNNLFALEPLAISMANCQNMEDLPKQNWATCEWTMRSRNAGEHSLSLNPRTKCCIVTEKWEWKFWWTKSAQKVLEHLQCMLIIAGFVSYYTRIDNNTEQPMRICMHGYENELLLKHIYIFVPFSNSFGAIIFQSLDMKWEERKCTLDDGHWDSPLLILFAGDRNR